MINVKKLAMGIKESEKRLTDYTTSEKLGRESTCFTFSADHFQPIGASLSSFTCGRFVELLLPLMNICNLKGATPSFVYLEKIS